MLASAGKKQVGMLTGRAQPPPLAEQAKRSEKMRL